MAVLACPLALLVHLCWLSLQCSSYRVDRESLHQDAFINPTATQRMFRTFSRLGSSLGPNLQRQQIFQLPQRGLHVKMSLRSSLLKSFNKMQRSQALGKYRYSTYNGRRKLMQKHLKPTLLKRFMSTQQALQFGRVYVGYMAKRDMRYARIEQGGTKEGWCTEEQMEEFKDRFYSGSSGIDGALSYNHPSSKFTSLYIMTSPEGDHNGAFKSLEGGSNQAGFWNMCARLLQMSSLYNVVYKRVNTLTEATEFVNQVKNDPDFVKDGKALKHVTISGHGSSSTLVLGEDRIRSDSLTSGGDTKAKEFLKELKPALIHTGEARSTVFLDSCSTGKMPMDGGEPLAQLVANALPGVEVHAFEDLSYPKRVKLQDNFVQDGKFQCKWTLKDDCLRASVFMAKDNLESVEPEPEPMRYDTDDDPVYSLSEISRSNVSVHHYDEDDEFVFYDGVSFMADPQMCAEWCGMISECHSFQFVELLDDEAVDLGMCVLQAAPLQSSPDELDLTEYYESLD